MKIIPESEEAFASVSFPSHSFPKLQTKAMD